MGAVGTRVGGNGLGGPFDVGTPRSGRAVCAALNSIPHNSSFLVRFSAGVVWGRPFIENRAGKGGIYLVQYECVLMPCSKPLSPQKISFKMRRRG